MKTYYPFGNGRNLADDIEHNTGVVDVTPEFEIGESMHVTALKFAKYMLAVPPGTYFYVAVRSDEMVGERGIKPTKKEGWHLVHKQGVAIVVPTGAPKTVRMNNYGSNWRSRVPYIYLKDIMNNHSCSNGQPPMSTMGSELRKKRKVEQAISDQIKQRAVQAGQPAVMTIKVKRRKNTGEARVSD
jgi:hypothetical protein